MKNTMLRITYKGLLMLVLSSLFSCTKDYVKEGSNSDGEVNIKINIQTPGISPGTYGMNSTQESVIRTLDVLVFNSNNKFSSHPECNLTQEGTLLKASFNVWCSTGPMDRYRMIFLANCRDKIDALAAGGGLNSTKSYDQLMALLKENVVDVSSTWPTDGIQMWGEIPFQVIDQTTAPSITSVSMLRSIARIDVGMTKTLPTGDNMATYAVDPDFSLESVIVYKPNTSYLIAPFPANYDAANFKATKPSLPSDVAYIANSNTYSSTNHYSLVGEIYTAEADVNMQSDGSGTVADANHIKRFALVIGGKYKGGATTYYRVDIAESAAKPKILDVLRNHLYQVMITNVAGPGQPTPDDAYNSIVCSMKANVIPWDENALNVSYDGQFYYSVDKRNVQLTSDAGSTGTATIKTNVPDWTMTLGGTTLNAPTAASPTVTYTSSFFKYTLTYVSLVGEYYNYTLDVVTTGSNTGFGTTAPADRIYNWQIKARNLQLLLTVTQQGEKLIWAPSNVNLSTDLQRLVLTEDPSLMSLFFKWGSVVGMRPAKDFAITEAYNENGNTVVWSPKSGMLYPTNADIPYMNDTQLEDIDKNYQNAHVSDGRGDPCRLIGLTNAEIAMDITDNGIWRMPTKSELLALNGGMTLYSPTWIDAGTNEYTFGGYLYNSVTPNLFLPAVSYRAPNGSYSSSTYKISRIWASTYSATTPDCLTYQWGNVPPSRLINSNRDYGFSVRCVGKGPVMTLSKRIIQVPAEVAGYANVTLTATGPWTTTSSDSWLSATASGSGSGTVTVNITKNDGAIRTGTITIIQPGFEAKITVVQGASPNSYVTNINGTVYIPVKKAYDIWAQSPLNTTLSGAQTATVLWQDLPNGGVIPSSTCSINGSGADAKITVFAGKNAGNAVVVLKVDGQIRWCWHIWVYDSGNYATNDPRTNTYTTPTGNVTFMNRNLGARNNNSGDPLSKGLYYAFERNTPFPGPQMMTQADLSYNNIPIYLGMDGQEARPGQPTGNTGIQSAVVAVDNNLANAILNPLTWYGGVFTGGSGSGFDWFTNNPRTGYNPHDTFWNTSYGSKGNYDPCPQGWRVPTKDMADLLPRSVTYTSGVGGSISGSSQVFPFTGYRYDRPGGGYMSVSSAINLWTSSPRLNMDATGYVISIVGPAPNGTLRSGEASYRACGIPVRCVQE